MNLLLDAPPIFKVVVTGLNTYRLVLTQTMLQGPPGPAGPQGPAGESGGGGTDDIEITDHTKGVILRTADGTRGRITLEKDADGNLVLRTTPL